MPAVTFGRSNSAIAMPRSSLRASGRAASRFRTGEIGVEAAGGEAGNRAACERCEKAGRPRRLNELLQHDSNEPAIALCRKCVHLLRYADARAWRWFREYRDRLCQEKL
jgi:hypothetical protein